MLRLARLDAPGVLHHVMGRGIERRDIFSSDEDRNDFITRLATLAQQGGLDVYAWARLGRKPELVGGGLVRSMGGWSEVVAIRNRGEKLKADQRILGDSDFVQEVVSDLDDMVKKNLRLSRITSYNVCYTKLLRSLTATHDSTSRAFTTACLRLPDSSSPAEISYFLQTSSASVV